MANVTITYDANHVHIDMGVLGGLPNINTDKVSYSKRALVEVQKPFGGTFLTLVLSVGVVKREWQVSLDGNNNSLPIDSVNGVVPVDLDDLYDKLEAIIVS